MAGLEQIPWLYDAMCALMERGGFGRWRRWLVQGARGRTLDLGTGTGRNLPLYHPDVTVIGVDPAEAPLLRARRRGPSVPLVRGRGESLPFRDGVFDTVVVALALCSVADPPAALAEIRRVLRPGGMLRVIEHVRARGRLKARFQDLVQPVWTRISGGCHPNRDTERTVERAGFRIDGEGRRAKGNMRRFAARP